MGGRRNFECSTSNIECRRRKGAGADKKWRRGRDSNPRYPFEVHTLSKRARSATPPPLRNRPNSDFKHPGRQARNSGRSGPTGAGYGKSKTIELVPEKGLEPIRP